MFFRLGDDIQHVSSLYYFSYGSIQILCLIMIAINKHE